MKTPNLYYHNLIYNLLFSDVFTRRRVRNHIKDILIGWDFTLTGLFGQIALCLCLNLGKTTERITDTYSIGKNPTRICGQYSYNACSLSFPKPRRCRNPELVSGTWRRS